MSPIITISGLTANSGAITDVQTVQPFAAVEVTDSVSGDLVSATISFAAAGGTLSGVTVGLSASAESVTTGSDTFSLDSHAKETVTAATAATDTTFAFTPSSTGPFYNDTIAGFVATGSNHDVLQFSASAFGAGLTAANQSADLAALLLDTTTTSGSAIIADIYGDAVTLTGVTKTTLALAANAGDFKFV